MVRTVSLLVGELLDSFLFVLIHFPRMLAFIFSVLIPNVTHIYIYSCFNVNMLNSTFLSAENIAAGCTAHVRHFCDYVSHSYACVLTVH